MFKDFGTADEKGDDSVKTHKKTAYLAACCVILFSIALFSVIVFSHYSHAWFAKNIAVQANGAEVALRNEIKYFLGTKGTYDDLLVSKPIVGKTFSQGETRGEYYVTESSMSIRLRSNNDSEGNLLFPGSCGEFTFYVISRDQVNGETISIKLDLAGYEEKAMGVLRSENEAVQDLLAGHIKFFGSKNGEAYEDYFENGELEVEMTSQTVEVTVYWAWEGLFSNYLDSAKWNAADYSKLVHDITDDIDAALDPGISDESYTSKYFSERVSGEIYDNAQIGEEWSVENIHWNRTNYLNDRYNEADQMIGTAFDYILLEIVLAQ